MGFEGNVHITSDAAWKGKGNSHDPFSAVYPDWPDTGAILQPRKSTFSPSTLGSTQKIYTGTLSDINQIAQWAVAKYMSYSITELPNQVFSIELTVPYDDIIYTDGQSPELTQWEIIPNSVPRSIFDAGIYYVKPDGTLDQTQRYTVPPIVQAAILRAVKDNGTIKITSEHPEYLRHALIAEQFYNLIKAGVTSVQSYTMTVRRSSVYSLADPRAYDNYPAVNDLGDGGFINPIISDTTLVNTYQMPDSIAQWLIRSYYRWKTSVAQGDAVDTVVLGGYLVSRPTRQFLTPTKVSITQTFQFDEWLDNLYPKGCDITEFSTPVSNSPYIPK